MKVGGKLIRKCLDSDQVQLLEVIIPAFVASDGFGSCLDQTSYEGSSVKR